MTPRMKQEIREENMQFFGDATYRCIPPTLRKFRLYVISAFNIILKITRIVCYSLIPNETEITYSELFRILKQDYGFNPKIMTLDFNIPSHKGVVKNFPDVYIIKCFFHFVNAIWKNLNKYNLCQKSDINATKEFAFNLKY